jgi:hypothetical protein
MSDAIDPISPTIVLRAGSGNRDKDRMTTAKLEFKRTVPHTVPRSAEMLILLGFVRYFDSRLGRF